MKITANNLWPRSLAAQLITLLVAVLLIGQMVNLALLIGERRIQARAQQFKQVINVSAQRVHDFPPYERADLPIALRPTGGMPGAFFVSIHNKAANVRHAKRLPKYERRYAEALERQGLSPLNITVVLQKKRPPRPDHNGGPNKRRPNNEYMSPPPPPRGRPDARPSARQDGVYHPRRRPDPSGPAAPSMQSILLSAEIQPGIWYNVMVPHYSLQGITPRLLLSTSILISLMTLAAWLFARRITRPLSELTRAAGTLGRGEIVQALQPRGPSDLQDAARAFNKMQARLTRLLETQRTMLRAIGHDLRTPLTSLRLRAEVIEDEKEREKFIATLTDMTQMTEEILSWAKDVSGLEENASIDLGALLSSLVDDYQDGGNDVSLKTTESVIVKVKRVALKRAVQNLVDNALKYGIRARVNVSVSARDISIHIEDDGPGIPEEKRADVLKPFVRLETSRSKDTGGIGLGLSIADSIAQTSGGVLTLTNSNTGGLRATISLPR